MLSVFQVLTFAATFRATKVLCFFKKIFFCVFVYQTLRTLKIIKLHIGIRIMIIIRFFFHSFNTFFNEKEGVLVVGGQILKLSDSCRLYRHFTFASLLLINYCSIDRWFSKYFHFILVSFTLIPLSDLMCFNLCCNFPSNAAV